MSRGRQLSLSLLLLIPDLTPVPHNVFFVNADPVGFNGRSYPQKRPPPGRFEESLLRILEDVDGYVDVDGDVDGDGDDLIKFVGVIDSTDGNPCSLCRGVPVDNELIPFGDILPNTTCAAINFDSEMTPPTAAATEHCRADWDFNRAFDACCIASIPVYRCEENIHRHIFSDDDYNSAVPPIIGSRPDERLNINVRFTLQAIENIDVEEGTAKIFMLMVLTWHDPRLEWDVKDYDTCANMVNVFTGHDAETATIWLPDLDLLNRIEGVQDMQSNEASVYADGTVVWSLDGGLTAFCAFQGLATMPFDKLGCQFIFGPTARDSARIRYTLEYPEYLGFGNFETTYNEWRVIPEMGRQGYALDSGVIYYNVFFDRATKHYISSIVIPTAVLTYLSFLTYLLDMRVGERLGFSMALALVVVAQQIITSEQLPTSDQRLLLEYFVSRSFYWVIVSVVQSVGIGLLFFLREDRENRNEKQRAEADEEEIQPLTMNGDDEAESGSRASVFARSSGGNRSGTPTTAAAADGGGCNSPATAATTTTGGGNLSKDGCFKRAIYHYPLRSYDLLCLAISILTYTVFLLLLFFPAAQSGSGGWWLQNEPRWFSENMTAAEIESIYPNN